MDAASYTIETADLNEKGDALVIEWADGQSSEYPLAFLRSRCPCATCRTHREEAKAQTDPFRVLPRELVQPNSEMSGVEPVGRYGMRIIWGDGHDTGIYTFEYLRELTQPASPTPTEGAS